MTQLVDTQPTEKKSTHKVEVVPVVLETHPNADSLSIVRVWGYQVIVRTEDWQGIDRGAYIVPDSVVPDTPEYAFLRPCLVCRGDEAITCGDCSDKRTLPLRLQDRRIRVRKFRKEMSQGMLVKAPDFAQIGDDISEYLGITRYSPPEPGGNHANVGSAIPYRGPSLYIPEYNVENWYRYGKSAFEDGEFVWITEKIHGCNWRCVYSREDDEFFVGSHHQWLRRYKTLKPKNWFHKMLQWLKLEKPVQVPVDNIWWKAANLNPEIEEWCRAYPDIVLFGEVYGDVQDLKYGHENGSVGVVLFDVFVPSRYEYSTIYSWYTYAKSLIEKFAAPLIFAGNYSDAVVREHIDGKSLIPGAENIREGIVITSGDTGEKLKAVSNAYLERVK